MIGTKPSVPQRFSAAAALTVLVATACSGGGGGGPGADVAPTLVTAAFVGSGPTPSIGDTLVLTFSEAVQLVGGKLLSDADVVLPPGETLGAVSVLPSQLSTNTVSIQLGLGVSFTPGTTQIQMRPPAAPGNDAIADTTGHLATIGPAVVIGTSDGSPPTISGVTISAIDGALNGTGPAGGLLQVPANGWTIDIAYSDNSAIATSLTQISANVPVGPLPAGADLMQFLMPVSVNNTAASYRVPASTVFPNGPMTLSCVIADVSGLGSTPGTFNLTVRGFTPQLQPFETSPNPSQVWFLDFARDVEQFTTSTISGGASVDVVATPNGRSDFEDILLVLGLTTASPIPNVEGGNNSNQVVIARYKAALLSELAWFYDGANVQFTLAQPGGSFGGNTSVAYGAIGFSQISIAGASNTAGVLGAAIFDPSNATQNDNTRVDFPGQRLGIFLHTIVDSGLGPPAASLFRLTYGQFAASVGGTPIGADPNDGARLTGANTDTRAGDINVAIQDLARFTAVVTSHECGHSVGLVVDGPMPVGLYGNDPNFGSSSGHISTPALFPPGATNIMSPSLSYAATINSATAFNSLNRAYLRQQVIYGN